MAAYIYKVNKTAPSASGCSSETLRVASFPALVVIRCRSPAMTQVIVLDESEQRSAYPPLRRAFVLRRATPQTSPQRIVITLCFISSFPAFHVSLRHPEVTPNSCFAPLYTSLMALASQPPRWHLSTFQHFGARWAPSAANVISL